MVKLCYVREINEQIVTDAYFLDFTENWFLFTYILYAMSFEDIFLFYAVCRTYSLCLNGGEKKKLYV